MFFWKEKPSLISLILNTKSEKHDSSGILLTSGLLFKSRTLAPSPSLCATLFAWDGFLKIYLWCDTFRNLGGQPLSRFLTYLLHFQIVNYVSKHLETKVKDMRRIFNVLHRTMYPKDMCLNSNASTVLAQTQNHLMMLMGQEFYMALKTNKYITG